ncbi:MAG: amidase [Chromatiales bacterium]|jgi:aspartyl-tRNA(Asn)/glutamyl-tRNA(Gln) amidotransferase subunit A|nr:amidase [Chromatiales bacterium]
MESDAIASSSMTALSYALADGSLTSTHLVETYLDRIRELDTHLHAWVDVYAQGALAAAQSADLARQSGHSLGPLHGIPIGIKDIIDIEGRITTGGSLEWAQRVSPTTATLVKRLVGAGMIVLGKTHTVEFAMGGWGTNTGMGTPRNPWDWQTHRAPGGSSAGSGVAVAAGMVSAAIGTDTGGSVRLPSAWNGLTGLKTTIGRVSCHGVLPLSTTLDTPGPMCKSAQDAAALFNVLQGVDPLDRSTAQHQFIDGLANLTGGVAGLRFAQLEQSELAGVEADCLDAYQSAIATLRGLGATVETLHLPCSIAEMGNRVGRIIGAEGYSFVGPLTDDPTSRVDPDIRPRIALGRNTTATEYLHMLRERESIKATIETAIIGFDAVLTPSTLGAAPVVAEIDQNDTPATFTRFVNFMDWCALSMPCGATHAGLPLSLQVACRYGREDLALRIGHAYQTATQWHERWPTL